MWSSISSRDTLSSEYLLKMSQLSKDRWKVLYINKDGLSSQENRNKDMLERVITNLEKPWFFCNYVRLKIFVWFLNTVNISQPKIYQFLIVFPVLPSLVPSSDKDTKLFVFAWWESFSSFFIVMLRCWMTFIKFYSKRDFWWRAVHRFLTLTIHVLRTSMVCGATTSTQPPQNEQKYEIMHHS